MTRTRDPPRVENLIGGLSKRANDLERGADILREQLKQPHASKLWLKSFASRDVGKDVSLLVDDINQAEKTGRVRKTTWARAHDKNDARRVQNTMGYQNHGRPLTRLPFRDIQSLP
ncbi:hypothetical protein OF83DRAFT_1180686 [Amylostereum chailletii]|nr:hypothetical protein OF83DRAFT_1180686 [Amylostereum chailletii]